MAIARRKTTKAPKPVYQPLALLDITTRDAVGRTPLHLAAFHGYDITVRRMLLQQAEVDARDDQQRTPGHWCAFKGHLIVIKLLIESGADVNARDAEGRTWLKMAIIGQQAEMEQFLRTRGGAV